MCAGIWNSFWNPRCLDCTLSYEDDWFKTINMYAGIQNVTRRPFPFDSIQEENEQDSKTSPSSSASNHGEITRELEELAAVPSHKMCLQDA